MDSSSKHLASEINQLRKDFEVETLNDDLKSFYVAFKGPSGSLYEGGAWKIKVDIPAYYPHRPPSIFFDTKIFHPNISEETGEVCVNLLGDEWNSDYDLTKVFEIILPALLHNPNPEDPLNNVAAGMLLVDRDLYETTVKDHCEKYAAKPKEDSRDDDGMGADRSDSVDDGNEIVGPSSS